MASIFVLVLVGYSFPKPSNTKKRKGIMEATSITQTKNMIIDLIKQPLSEKIDFTGTEIHDALINGAIDSATEAIRELSSWFEDLVWEAYLTSLFQSTMILSWLRKLGAKKGSRLVSYQPIWITLSTGTKIQIRSPFFVIAVVNAGYPAPPAQIRT